MVYGYIRVSTAKQDTANQQYEICKYAKKNKLKINAFIKEKISGTKNYKKRKLGNLLYKLNKGDIIIASELTRFGRSLYMIMDVLNYCLSKECIVITIKDNFVLGESIESKVLAFAFGLAGEIERNLISERTKQALERRKKNGTKLGRPKGAKNKVNYLEKHYLQIEMYLSQNKSGLWLSKRYNVHYNTMYSFLKTHKLNSKKSA